MARALSPRLISFRVDKRCSAWDVNAHVIASAGVTLGEGFVGAGGVDAIEATEIGRIRVEDDFVVAGNLDACESWKFFV
jgi:hypothetical protein